MSQRFDESKAVIGYGGVISFSGETLAPFLMARLAQFGFEFDEFEIPGPREVLLYGPRYIVSVCIDEPSSRTVQVAVECGADGRPDGPASDARFLLCAAATRIFVDAYPAQSIVWHHEGSSYVTERDGSLARRAPARARWVIRLLDWLGGLARGPSASPVREQGA